MGGGIARLHDELARRFPPGELIVSTPADPDPPTWTAPFLRWIGSTPDLRPEYQNATGVAAVVAPAEASRRPTRDARDRRQGAGIRRAGVRATGACRKALILYRRRPL